MKEFVRMIVVICEIAIPALLGAKYGIGAGVAAIFMIILCAMDGAIKELIDEEKEQKS